MKMKTLIVISLMTALVVQSGCAALARSQAEGKIPKVNAKVYQAELNTIYGASVLINETDVKWEGDIKNVGSSDVRINTPFGGFHEKMESASFPKK
jgi:hypothetical protein